VGRAEGAGHLLVGAGLAGGKDVDQGQEGSQDDERENVGSCFHLSHYSH
jgi:hypothetical protein